MKGLVLKDILVIAKRFKIMLFLIAVISFYGGTGIIMGGLICAMLSNTAIAYDDRSKWNNLALMLPYSRKDIVIGKYVVGYVFLFVGMIYMAIIQIVGSLISPFTALDPVLMGLTIIAALLTLALYLPLSYWLGVEKARFLPIVLIVAASALTAGLAVESPDIISLVESLTPLLPIVLPVLAIVLNIISILISIRVFTKKTR